MELNSVLEIIHSAIENNQDHFMPITISWHNIDVFTKSTKYFYPFHRSTAQKQILKGVSGEIKPGQFLAIMGSSGAGKTTLLNVLTTRNLSEVSVKGVVKLNGQLTQNDMISHISAYVQQQGLFIPVLTVREHLNFQAALRLDQNITKQERHKRVEEVMRELSLTKCSETRIGSNTTFKGISGGEANRLAFASELLTNPSLLFCDEPTSGLDSFMAESVIQVMKSLASKGRTVVCTIHQPSSQMFELFDQLLLMADGRVAYMGDRGDALNFFSSIDLNCSPNFNPADFFIKELSIIPGTENECRDKVHSICDQFMNKSHDEDSNSELESQSSFDLPRSNINKSPSRYKAGFWRQLYFLIWRSFLENSRNTGTLRSNLCTQIILALVIGIVEYNSPLNQVFVSNSAGVVYYVLIMNCLAVILVVVQTFTFRFALFVREYKNRTYRVNTYYLSHVIVQIPVLTILPIVSVCIYYFMIKLNPNGVIFILHMILMILVTQAATSLGYLLSCACSSHQVVNAIMLPIGLCLSLIGGYYVNSSTLPRWLSWFKYLSIYYYAYEGMIINQWQDIDNIPCDQLTQCLTNGTEVINYYGFNENNFCLDFVVLILFSFVFQLLAFISLYIRALRVK